jgi:outer membrane protein OmpA-like peptidoglycan-associated protein
VAVAKNGLELTEKVQFELNRDIIASSSLELLDAVTATLKAHPEISHLVIEGHTDNMGPAAFNRSLSLRRAEAVRRYLIDHGVDAARLEAKGFGPDHPLVLNTDSAARERNRRVEFTTSHSLNNRDQ